MTTKNEPASALTQAVARWFEELDDPIAGYARHAAAAMTPFSRRAVDVIVREELLPRLLG